MGKTVLRIRPYYSNVKTMRRLFQIFCQAFLIDPHEGQALWDSLEVESAVMP